MHRKPKNRGSKKTSNESSRSQEKEGPSAEEIKAGRDTIATMLTDPKHANLDEKTLSAAHFIMAIQTKIMAEKGGLVDEDRHVSLDYCKANADKIFSDGGTKFFGDLKAATEKAKLEKKRNEEMEKLKKDGDVEGQLRLAEEGMRSLVVERDAMLARGDSPPEGTNGGPFLCSLIDDELFQPSPRPDCPICCLPLPVNYSKKVCVTYQPCCGKVSNVHLFCDCTLYNTIGALRTSNKNHLLLM